MPGTVICVRFGETELAGLDALCRDRATTRSRVIRTAVSQALMHSTLNTEQAQLAMSVTDAALARFFPAAFDKDGSLAYDEDGDPASPAPLTRPVSGDPTRRASPPSGDRSEPDVVPPPAAQRLPVPDSLEGAAWDQVERRVGTPRTPRSRSQRRRVATQKGEPAPDFGPTASGLAKITYGTPGEMEERLQLAGFGAAGHDRGAGGRLQSTSDPCPVPIPPTEPLRQVLEKATENMSADELDAWFDEMLDGAK